MPMKKLLFILLIVIITSQAAAVLADESQTLITAHKKHAFLSFTHELDSFMRQYNDPGISIYYENLESGYRYFYNENKIYYSASIIKAPYALYLYQQSIDMSRLHTYTENFYRPGAGVIKRMSPGSVFTGAELLEYSVVRSDNIAFRMLLSAYGTEGFTQWVADLGGETQRLRNLTGADMTVMDAAFFMRQIYDYIEAPGENNAKLKKDMLNATFPYIQTQYPFAHKYGLWDEAHHDMGIVYAQSPYILIIMTNKGSSEPPLNPNNRVIFREISEKMYEINNQIIQLTRFTINRRGFSSSQ
jgi:beta-lactamase class A